MKFSQITYNRPDLEAAEKELKELSKSFANADSSEVQVDIIKQIDRLERKISTARQIASIRHSINTKDELYEGEQQFYDSAMPKFNTVQTDFCKAVVKSEFRSALGKELGDQYIRIAEMNAKTNDDTIIGDMQEENKLSSEYTKLIAGAVIEYEGEEYNLSGLTPFAQSMDRNVRKNATAARTGFYEKSSAEAERIYHDMVRVRTQMARRLGYDNFVELGYNRMLRSDYGPQEVAGYRESIQKYVVPVSLKLRESQRKRLGLDKLYHYDLGLMFAEGNPKPQGDPDWIIANGKKMYSELSPETKEFFDFMMDNELMDLVNKKGKAAGGYCTIIPDYKAPFIFSNFNGTSGDIDVLTHEAGHAFQVYSSRETELSEYFFPTYEACEIHSMSMEFFTMPWMHLFFGEQADRYKYYNVAGAVNFLPYGATVDEFQHRVYENPDMSIAERNAAYAEIENSFLPYKDYEGNSFLEKGGFWQRQAHIFKSPFYYIDYTLAQVCAFQFLIKMEKDFESAWKDYVRLCQAGGSQSFLELVDYANLKSPFEEQTMRETMEQIEELLFKMEDSKL